jgi:hypothetical protein
VQTGGAVVAQAWCDAGVSNKRVDLPLQSTLWESNPHLWIKRTGGPTARPANPMH